MDHERVDAEGVVEQASFVVEAGAH